MRELVLVVTGRVAQILIGLLALRLMTWRLDQEEMGQFSLIITVTTLFALALINPLGMYFNRSIHQAKNEQRGSVLFFLVAVGCVLVAFVSLSLILVSRYAGLDIDVVWMAVLIPGSLILVSLNNTVIPGFNILGHRVVWVVFSVLTLGMSLLFSLYFVSHEATAEFWILGQLAGHGLLLLPAVCYFLYKIRGGGVSAPFFIGVKGFWLSRKKDFYIFAWPLSIAVTLNWGQFQSFRVFLGEMTSLETLGYFAAAYAVSAGVMASIESIAQQYFYPKFYRDVSVADREVCIQSWKQYAACMIPIVTLFFMFVLAFAKPLLFLLVDNKFHSAVFFVYIAACIEYCRILGNIYGVFMQATKETKALIFPQLLGSFLALLSVPLMIKLHGVSGFSLAVVLSSVCYVCFIRAAVKRSAALGFDSRVCLELTLVAVAFLGVSYGVALVSLDLLRSLLILFAGGLFALAVLVRIFKRYKVLQTYES